MELLAFLLLSFLIATAPSLVAMRLLAPLERAAPARTQERPYAGSNLKIWLPNLVAKLLGGGAMGAVVTLAWNSAGFGYVMLPSAGWGLVLSCAIYMIAMDLGEYLYHRAQHAIPLLWALHSLHHSDETYDATTTLRHHWLDPLIKSCTVWLAVALVFKTPPIALLVYGVVTLWHFVAHSNLRLSLGRFSWLLITPHYHRRHHGADPRYYNSNYAALFPIFDVMTGAYRRPAPDDYPQTGLGEDREPRTFADIIAWPLKPPYALPTLRARQASRVISQ